MYPSLLVYNVFVASRLVGLVGPVPRYFPADAEDLSSLYDALITTLSGLAASFSAEATQTTIDEQEMSTRN